MELTIKTIRGIAATNLIILGLAGCSSSPAPWTQAEDSPWEAKYAAESQNVPSDSAVTDTSLNDPGTWSRTSAWSDCTCYCAGHDTWAGNHGNAIASMEKFKADKGLENLIMVKTDRSGSIVYVLVEVHHDRAEAKAAAAELEIKTGSKPWVRSIAGLQKIIAE